MTLITFASHIVSCLGYIYFYSHLLVPKHHKKIDLIYSIIIFVIMSWICNYLIYEYTMFKPLINYLTLVFAMQLLYQGNLKYKLFIAALTCVIAVLAEVILMLLGIIFYQHSFYVSSEWQQIFIASGCMCLLFLFYTIAIQIINKRIKFIGPFYHILGALIIYFTIAAYIIGNMYDGDLETCKLNHSALYHDIRYGIFIALIPVIIFLLIYIKKALFQLDYHYTKEITIQKLQKENETYLTQLLDRDEKTKYLRHDLMNYLETYQKLKHHSNNKFPPVMQVEFHFFRLLIKKKSVLKAILSYRILLSHIYRLLASLS